MHTDSGMNGISLSGYMPYMTVASLEMSDEPELLDIMERLANHYVATEYHVCRPLDDRIWNACKT